MRKKILVTASTFPAFENDSRARIVLDICKSISWLGKSDIFVLAPHCKHARLTDTLEGIKVLRYRYAYPVELECISGQGMFNKIMKNNFLSMLVPLFVFSQLFKSIKIILTLLPDIVIGHWIIPQGLVTSVIKKLFPNIRTVLVCHGTDGLIINHNRFLTKMGEIIFKNTDKVIAVNKILGNLLLDRFPFLENKLSVIYCSADIKRFAKCRKVTNWDKPRNNYNILFIGRLENVKGVSYIIEAMKAVIKCYPKATLSIIGDGTQRDFLMNLSISYKLNRNIFFLGAKGNSELVDYLAETDLLIVPSVNLSNDVEGIPVVIFEAMAAKVTIITTDAGGICEVIKHYETGLIIQQKDIDKLSEGIITLLTNDCLRQRLAENAFEVLNKDFSLEMTGEKYQNIIDALM
jgi:glycosyltransferase involved in cell wall biosynthesis